MRNPCIGQTEGPTALNFLCQEPTDRGINSGGYVELCDYRGSFQAHIREFVRYDLPVAFYHVTQPDHWNKPPQPSLCGSKDPTLVAYDMMRQLLAIGSLRREEICEICWIEFEGRTAKA